MNYGDHNFIEITQQTKLRVALVVLTLQVLYAFAFAFEPVELIVSFAKHDSTKMHGLDTSNM